MQTIAHNFPVTEEEYYRLEDKFGKLCHYASWQLKNKNTKNNHTDEEEDIVQEARIAMMRAASYYKRQTYIENSFEILDEFLKDKFVRKLLEELQYLWQNRTRHGANRQKFGTFQELLMDRLLRKYVPKSKRPDRRRSLIMDNKFSTYCKQIIWNSQKSLGKKITKEKSWRTGLCSLSEFDYLGAI